MKPSKPPIPSNPPPRGKGKKVKRQLPQRDGLKKTAQAMNKSII